MRSSSVEQRLGRLDVLIARGIARVDDVEQQVGVGGLLERRAEGGEQVLRQLADEADGVGDHHLALLGEAQAARARVERGEQLVLGEHVGAGQRVEQRALAGVGVADDRDHRHAEPGARAAALLALARRAA